MRPERGPSVLHQRDPTVKLVLVLVLTCAMLAVTDPVTPTLTHVAVVAGVLACGALTPRAVVMGHLVLAGFAVGVVVVNVVTRPGPPVHLGPLEISAPGLEIGWALAVRALTTGVLALALTATTDPYRLMTSVRVHARVPAPVTFAVLAAASILHSLPRSWETIRAAHALRDPGAKAQSRAVRTRALPRRPAALAPAALALLVTSLRRGERLAVSMQTRGLGTGPRTTYRPAPLDRGDLALAVVVLAGYGLLLTVSAWAGWLRGPGGLLT